MTNRPEARHPMARGDNEPYDDPNLWPVGDTMTPDPVREAARSGPSRWHGDDICGGAECQVTDEYGDHPRGDARSPDWYDGYAAGQKDATDTSAVPLDVLGQAGRFGSIMRAPDGRWYIGTADLAEHPSFDTPGDAVDYLVANIGNKP